MLYAWDTGDRAAVVGFGIGGCEIPYFEEATDDGEDDDCGDGDNDATPSKIYQS